MTERIIAFLLLAVVASSVSGCRALPQVRLQQEVSVITAVIELLDAASDVLVTVVDDATARSALPQLEAIIPKIEPAQRKMNQMPADPTADDWRVVDYVGRKHGPRLNSAADRFDMERDRINELELPEMRRPMPDLLYSQ
jgi:hypothetical protein